MLFTLKTAFVKSVVVLYLNTETLLARCGISSMGKVEVPQPGVKEEMYLTMRTTPGQ